MVDGTIVVEENRSVIDSFRFLYKEKVIDTGKAQEFEENLDKVNKKTIDHMIIFLGLSLSKIIITLIITI